MPLGFQLLLLAVALGLAGFWFRTPYCPRCKTRRIKGEPHMPRGQCKKCGYYLGK